MIPCKHNLTFIKGEVSNSERSWLSVEFHLQTVGYQREETTLLSSKVSGRATHTEKE